MTPDQMLLLMDLSHLDNEVLRNLSYELFSLYILPFFVQAILHLQVIHHRYHELQQNEGTPVGLIDIFQRRRLPIHTNIFIINNFNAFSFSFLLKES